MRIAYVSHVDSKWIKQRPHFIAESMSSRATYVAYVCSLFVKKRFLVNTQRMEIPVYRMPMLPQRFRLRFALLDPIASAISALIIFALIRPKVVIFTHARHWRIAKVLRSLGVRVFYDCMDLNGLFADATSDDREGERLLIEMSETVFCSSKIIIQHVLNACNTASTQLIPNALQPSSFRRFSKCEPIVDQRVVGYIGAISSWFDFDAILLLLENEPEVIVRLWGPVDVFIPTHSRLEVMGVVSHDDALEAMHTCAVLVLPFILSDLILAVDPVKVYEYISTGRPTVVRDYPQLEHFGAFVQRYVSHQDFLNCVQTALSSKGLVSTDVLKFMNANSWNDRAELMLNRLS